MVFVHVLFVRFGLLANREQVENTFVQPVRAKILNDIPGVRIDSVKPVWICTVMGRVRLVAANGET